MYRVLFIIFLFGSLSGYSQNFEKYNRIDFKNDSDYVKHQDKVLECADYILSHDSDEKDYKLAQASKFVLIWMIGAPYTFELWTWGSKLGKKQIRIFSAYCAALVKVGLEQEKFEGIEAQYAVALIIYDYLTDYKLLIKRKGYVKKFIKAGESKELKSFIEE